MTIEWLDICKQIDKVATSVWKSPGIVGESDFGLSPANFYLFLFLLSLLFNFYTAFTAYSHHLL